MQKLKHRVYILCTVLFVLTLTGCDDEIEPNNVGHAVVFNDSGNVAFYNRLQPDEGVIRYTVDGEWIGFKGALGGRDIDTWSFSLQSQQVVDGFFFVVGGSQITFRVMNYKDCIFDNLICTRYEERASFSYACGKNPPGICVFPVQAELHVVPGVANLDVSGRGGYGILVK